MQLNKFVNIPDDTPLHSSGYVDPASAGMGSTSTETFAVRKERESNRVHIAGYKRSIIGQPVMARKYQRPAERQTLGKNTQTGQAKSTLPTQLPPSQPRRFQEPGGRGYNPYS